MTKHTIMSKLNQLATSRSLVVLITINCLLLLLCTPIATFKADQFEQVPGLYDQEQNITKIQGEAELYRLVKEQDTHGKELAEAKPMDKQVIKIVQFYMATCPDCQGFSPYFKRFVKDVNYFWRSYISFYVVNCNDDQNLQVCWHENPILLVPLVRWYAFSKIGNSMLNEKLSDQTSGAERREKRDELNFSKFLLSVDHRSFIDKQRRDLLSLRRATLRYIDIVLDELYPQDFSIELHCSGQANEPSNINCSKFQFHQSLSWKWRQLRPLGRDHSKLTENSDVTHESDTMAELRRRLADCLSAHKNSSSSDPKHVHNVVLIGSGPDWKHHGMTLVADWSNWMCSGDAPYMVHYSRHPETLLKSIGITERPAVPYLIYTKVKTDEISNLSSAKQLKWEILRSNNSTGSSRSRGRRGGLLRFRRDNRDQRKNSSSRVAEEHSNWLPEEFNPGEEALRYKLNQLVKAKLFPEDSSFRMAGFEDGHQGEIKKVMGIRDGGLVEPRDEDLMRLKLTDYYKILDEIVEKNMLSKAQLDGYQVVTSACFTKQLISYFPFQGGGKIRQLSTSRQYLELLYGEYEKSLLVSLNLTKSSSLHDGDLCDERLQIELHKTHHKVSHNLREKLRDFRISSEKLQTIQRDLMVKTNFGLPASSNFKWQYCAGSSPYLRGHTCSLWVLFHSLTVNEFISKTSYKYSASDEEPEEYQFQIRVTNKTLDLCDPKNPEPALLESSNEQLFIPKNQFVLSNIINFVRYYLSCTNCAAHFSCMVLSSPPRYLNNNHPDEIELKKEKVEDEHLLWLWEAHNKVNIRTKKTHSEDPKHPKHVFPVYDACPKCYLAKPENGAKFEEMKFNKRELIDFIVSRYRQSAILNNKLKIEDLFRVPATVPKPTS